MPVDNTKVISPRLSKGRDAHLDGMRGIAAFIVLITHTLAAFWPTTVYGPLREGSVADFLFLRTPLAILTNGHFAVGLFFILSGYVLTKKYFTSPPPTLEKLAPDIGKRFTRLYLAAFPAAVAAALLMWSGCYYNVPAAELTHSRWLADSRHTCSGFELALVVINPLMCLTDKYNPVAWSLFVELWGSIAAFCIVIATSQLATLGRIVFGVAIVVLSRLSALGNGDSVTYGYLGFFAIGVLFADFEPKLIAALGGGRRTTPIQYAAHYGAWALAIALCAIPHYALFHGEPTLLPKPAAMVVKAAVMGGPSGALAILVFAIVLLSHAAKDLLSKRMPAYLGRISVGLYLVHMPILYSLGCSIVSHHSQLGLDFDLSRQLAACAVVMASLGVGHAYSVLFDDFAVNVSRRLGQLLRGNLRGATPNCARSTTGSTKIEPAC